MNITFKRKLAGVVFLSIFTTLAYFNSLKGVFQFDDVNLHQQRYVYDLYYFWQDSVFLPSACSSLNCQGFGFGRILNFLGNFDLHLIGNRNTLLFTFALNNHLNFNRVFGFHLVNLLLHSLVVTLIYFILIQTLRLLNLCSPQSIFLSRENDRSDPNHPWHSLPLVSALLFAVHPLTTDSVTYISSRSTVLMTFFYLLCFYGFLKMFRIEKSRNRVGYRTLLGVGVIIGFYLALTSKLSAATLPVVLVVSYFLLIASYTNTQWQKNFWNKKKFLWALPFLIVPAKLANDFLVLDSGLRMYGRINYLFVQFKVVVFYYLKMFLWPFNQNVDVGFPFSQFNNDIRIFLSILLVFSFLAFTFIWGGRLLKLAMAWAILTLAPTSSLMPLSDLAVEHRLYLPMALGLCPILAMTTLSISNPFRKNGFLFYMLICLALLTISRNQLWIDEFSLWQDASKKNTRSGRPPNNLGKAYYEKGDLKTSIQYFQKSLALSPYIPDSHYNLANVYMDIHRLVDAKKEYEKAIELKPLFPEALLGLGSIHSQTGRYQEAIEQYQNAIKARQLTITGGDYPFARLNLGEVYGKIGRYEDAIRELKIAVERNPNMYKAYYNLGTAYLKLQKFDYSERAFQACLNINPNFKQALFNLGHLFQLKKEWEQSNEQIHKFLQIEPSHPKAYFILGVNAIQLGDPENAERHFKKTLALKPNDPNAHINLGNLLIKQGQIDSALNHFQQVLKTNPRLYQIHVQLGRIEWEHRNNRAKALDHFQKALEIANDIRAKSQINQLITRLSAP